MKGLILGLKLKLIESHPGNKTDLHEPSSVTLNLLIPISRKEVRALKFVLLQHG